MVLIYVRFFVAVIIDAYRQVIYIRTVYTVYTYIRLYTVCTIMYERTVYANVPFVYSPFLIAFIIDAYRQVTITYEWCKRLHDYIRTYSICERTARIPASS